MLMVHCKALKGKWCLKMYDLQYRRENKQIALPIQQLALISQAESSILDLALSARSTP